MRPVVAGHPVEEVKIVAAIVALLRIFHPAIFPIVVRVYSRNCSGHIGEIEVRQLAAALEAPDSGSDFQPLCHLTGNVGAELELLGSGVGDDSRVVDVGHGDEIFGSSVGAVGRKVVLLVYSFLIDGVHPVGVRIGDIVRVAGLGDSVRILGLLPPQVDHRLRERQDSVHILRRLVHKRHIIGIIGDHLELVGGLVDGHHSAVGDAYLTGGLASVLCGDEDDAVSSPVSVDGAGSRVLQHGHGLDVIRVHVGDRTLETIDYDKRIGGVQCPDTADPERKSFLARTAGSLAHRQTGVHSLKDLGGARHRTGFHLLGVIDSGDRSGDVHPLLRAVADYDKLFKFIGVRFQSHIDDIPAGHLHLFGEIAEEADGKSLRVGGLDLELSVSVRGDTSHRVGNGDGRTGQRLGCLIEDRTFHCSLLRGCGQTDNGSGRGQKAFF